MVFCFVVTFITRIRYIKNTSQYSNLPRKNGVLIFKLTTHATFESHPSEDEIESRVIVNINF